MSQGKATRWLLPPAASIAVHAGLVIALAAVTIEVTRDRPTPRPTRVTLSAPPQSDAPARIADTNPSETAELGAGAVPAPAEPAALRESLASGTARGAPVSSPTQLAPAPVTQSILTPENAGAPRVRFAEIDAAPARTVVFVVDASGAVASAFTFVREELLRSIDQLSPTQRFQVVVFPGPENGPPVLAPINRGRLALASPRTKREIAEWMATFRPRGRSAPLEGLRLALDLKPDIAMLITRSIERTGPDAAWGDGLKETLEELDRLNPIDRRTGVRRTAIAAVQLLDEDPTGIMEAIAAIHGSGVSDYRVVSAETLASPSTPPTRATGASESASIDASASILADLDDTGTALRLFHGLPDATDRTRAREQAARAAELAARTPDDPRARVLLARARSLTLEPSALEMAGAVLRQELLHDPDADAWRRLALIDTLAAQNRPADAIDELEALFEDAREMAITRAIRVRMVVTGAALGIEPDDADAALQRPPFVDDRGVTDPYWVLAMGEAMTRGRLRTGASEPFVPLLRLLERAEREHADAWPPILTDRMARAAALAPERVAEAPARVRLEVAAAWARTPESRPRARVVLGSLVNGDSPERAEALWRLGVLERGLDTPESRERAGELLSTLAETYPDHPRAGDALAGAIALTSDPQARERLLRLAVERHTDRPEIDLWRLNLAELLDGLERLDMLERIAPGGRESTLARRLYKPAAESIVADATDPAPLLERAGAFLAAHADPEAASWLARASSAWLADDAERAHALAERAMQASGRTPSAETELALIRAELATGRSKPATARLSALATRLDAANDRSGAFWESWTLLLEAAGRDDPDAARAHLARLELIDPELGGDPWRRRLNDLRAALP
ncbi:MAG: hypothetical protein D6692_06925 [Planctomycetota bacterium]|nr:MAG: hypothetical protein D6692_06925 [Planctomycetota bacterium]